MNKERFLDLQREVVSKSVLLTQLQEKMVAFELKQFSILMDPFFNESLSSLIKMVDISRKSLDLFTNDLKQLMKSDLPFSWEDLLKEWSYIGTNILLEENYFFVFLFSVHSQLNALSTKEDNLHILYNCWEALSVLLAQMEWNNYEINNNYVGEKEALRI